MVRFPKKLGAAVLMLFAAYLGWDIWWPVQETVEKAALRLDPGAEVPAIGLARLGR